MTLPMVVMAKTALSFGELGGARGAPEQLEGATEELERNLGELGELWRSSGVQGRLCIVNYCRKRSFLEKFTQKI